MPHLSLMCSDFRSSRKVMIIAYSHLNGFTDFFRAENLHLYSITGEPDAGRVPEGSLPTKTSGGKEKYAHEKPVSNLEHLIKDSQICR